jgi:hypothetical protein
VRTVCLLRVRAQIQYFSLSLSLQLFTGNNISETGAEKFIEVLNSSNNSILEKLFVLGTLPSSSLFED